MSKADLDWLVLLLIAVILAALCAFWAARIARQKNRGVGEAVALGALLGLIGVVIVALLPSQGPAERKAPPPARDAHR
jgi:hypothetical protein